jgi:hypothetical protein
MDASDHFCSLRPLGRERRRDARRVRAVELVTNQAQLPRLELADGESARPISRPDDRGVHELGLVFSSRSAGAMTVESTSAKPSTRRCQANAGYRPEGQDELVMA